MPIDKVYYNEASAAKLGWDPTWFGHDAYDEKLVRIIKKWQKENGLTADGLCGPGTFRRIWTEREANISDYVSPNWDNDGLARIVYNGKEFPIEWDKTVLWTDKGGLMAKLGNYKSMAGQRVRKPTQFVNHWDVCLSSKSCQRVLDRRGISVHFLIDNDGTIYQTMDIQHIGWHAGSSKINAKSIGVEISCAYDLKWQSWYKKNGFGERPVVTDAYVHGKKLRDHLGFYPVQIEALKALWKAIHNACDIPLETPTGAAKNAYTSTVSSGKFKGFVSHYHITKRKIDCGGLDIEKLLEDLK
tara:strand:+ start:4161 stop:5060 length:900 start_codon:yes stop_codon:yes gene_type:complete